MNKTPFSSDIVSVLLLGAGLIGWAGPAAALPTNGIQTLTSGTICAFGGRSSNTPYRVRGAAGLPGGGTASNGLIQAQGQFGESPVPTAQTFTATIPVTGNVIGTPEIVTVNGVTAAVDGTSFSASVPLAAGKNTITAVASYADGSIQVDQITVVLDIPSGQQVPLGSTVVEGTVDDTVTGVTVNTIAAVISPGHFAATVPLHTGYNTITAIATNATGNINQHAIGVFVPAFTTHPAIPTVGALPAVASQSSITLNGTKMPGTTVWVNGLPVGADPQASTWELSVELTEGDNEGLIMTRDTNGVWSAPIRVVVVLDELPPVVVFDPPAKTNDNPVLLQGTVDDHLTSVTINGQPATLNGRTFQVLLPLSPGTPGTYPLNLTATSPNNHVTNVNDSIILGLVPNLQTVSPSDGSFILIGVSSLIQATATDADPISYRAFFDGVPLSDWVSTLSQSWLPSTTQAGLHTIRLQAKDDYGGLTEEAVEVFVVHQPISHP